MPGPPPALSSTRRAFGVTPLFCLQTALLILAAAFVSAPAWHGGWLWDDVDLVVRNPAVRAPGGLWKIWFERPTLDYFPLTGSVQWLQWRLWRDDTFGYHLTNAVLHGVSAGLIWRLLSRLGIKEGWWGAMLFIVHPMAVESVAWIAELKNVLSLPFFLLAVIAYVDAEAIPGRRRSLFACWLWFLLSMLAKTSGIMLPAVMLLYGWWRRGRITRSHLVAAAGCLPICLALGLATLGTQQRMGAGSIDLGGPLARFLAAGLAAAFYVAKSVWPLHLQPLYPRWTVAADSAVQYLPWVTGIAVGGWLVVRRGRTEARATLLAGGFLGLNLVPILGFLPMYFLRLSRVADHFAYLPLVGFVGLAAAGLGWLRVRVPVASLAAAAVCGLLGVAARDYARNFRSEEALWAYALRSQPNSGIAHNNAGVARLEAGRVPEALAQFQDALRLQPGYADAWLNLGNAFSKLQRWPDALAAYRRALDLKPDFNQARINLGRALVDSGRRDEGVREFRAALALDPESVEACDRLGGALCSAHRFGEAVADYEKASRLDPGNADEHNNLGYALVRTNRLTEAIVEFEAAVRIRPDFATAQNNLGAALVNQGHRKEGIEHIRRALQLQPDYDEARQNLEKILGRHGPGAAPQRR